MKKRILLSVVLAVVLSFSFTLPVAAGGNIVDRDQGTDTQTYSWWSGPYLVEDVFHVSWHITSYSDGDLRNHFNLFWVETWYLDGVEVGIYKEGQRFSYNDNVGSDAGTNYLVQHNGIIEMEAWGGSVSSYQYWANFANGELRVEWEKIQ